MRRYITIFLLPNQKNIISCVLCVIRKWLIVSTMGVEWGAFSRVFLQDCEDLSMFQA